MKQTFKSTKMDQQGRIFLPDLLRRRLGLRGIREIEFSIKDDGSVVVGKASKGKSRSAFDD